MLIGGVAGLAAFDLAGRYAPDLVPSQVTVAGVAVPAPSFMVGAACVVVSAVVALWPDLDKPDSFISHVGTRLMWVAGGLAGLMIASDLANGLASGLAGGLVAGVILGAMAGLVIGLPPVMTVLRVLSGGHRRLTHSVLVGAGLAFGAWVLYLLHLGASSLLLAILSWGLFLHLVGDVVTPGGVALFFPIWPGDIHLAPFWFAAVGEPVVAIVAALVGAYFIWGWGP